MTIFKEAIAAEDLILATTSEGSCLILDMMPVQTSRYGADNHSMSFFDSRLAYK
jgi:hypothetical protein